MNQPNIIYILSDQHNFSKSEFMGDEIVLTPNLDELARKGVVLKNCYCNSPLCVPSRSSLLTGRLPCTTEILNNMQMLPSDKVTMAHSLTIAGYESVLCGRMHFSGADQRHGFEKRLVGDVTSSFPGYENPNSIYGKLRGTTGQSRESIVQSGAGSSSVLKFDEDVTKAACHYIKDRVDKRPLFMIVGFYSPHCPYVAEEEWFNYYYDKLSEDEEVNDYLPVIHPAIKKWRDIRDVNGLTSNEFRRVRAAYYAMITIMDINIGNIVKEIKENLDIENTVIVYGSDHGDNIGEHGLFWKTNFYEGASRVPMIFSGPKYFRRGETLNSLTSLIDVAPTLIDLAGAKQLPKMDGISLLPYLSSNNEAPERYVISILGDIKGDSPSAMIRLGDYKLIVYYGYNQPQLFNLKNDPKENHDLSYDNKYKNIIIELSTILAKYWDGDKAYEQLMEAEVHVNMLKEWVDIVGWKPQEEWHAQTYSNYIINNH